MQLHQLLSAIHNFNINYTLYQEDAIAEEIDFFPASLKRIIPNGIYFIQDAQAIVEQDLQDSIILAKERIPQRVHQIIVENPQLLHYKISQLFEKKRTNHIHSTAIISDKAVIGRNVHIGPYCVVGECVLEDDVVLMNHVVIEDQVCIKRRSFIDSHSVIGAGGLAWIWDQQGHRIMQAQLGGVIIGEDCILATDITVVKGSLSENTVIDDGTVIAHGTKIGHGAQIGKKVHMANNVSLAGNAVIGDYSFLGSACVISSNITIPKHTIVGAAALVSKNFTEEYLTLAGVPAAVLKRNNFEEKPKGAPIPFVHKKND